MYFFPFSHSYVRMSISVQVRKSMNSFENVDEIYTYHTRRTYNSKRIFGNRKSIKFVFLSQLDRRCYVNPNNFNYNNTNIYRNVAVFVTNWCVRERTDLNRHISDGKILWIHMSAGSFFQAVNTTHFHIHPSEKNHSIRQFNIASKTAQDTTSFVLVARISQWVRP